MAVRSKYWWARHHHELMRRDLRTKMTVVVGVAVVVAGVWLLSRAKPDLGVTPSASPSAGVSGSPTPKTTYKPGVTPPGAPLPQSYQDALVTYANRRMQFDQYCQAQPPRLALQRGLSVMLDNRSGDARTFAVGGVYFTLPGYGWKIFTPYATTFPATIYVDCGSARNVGTIILQ